MKLMSTGSVAAEPRKERILACDWSRTARGPPKGTRAEITRDHQRPLGEHARPRSGAPDGGPRHPDGQVRLRQGEATEGQRRRAVTCSSSTARARQPWCSIRPLRCSDPIDSEVSALTVVLTSPMSGDCSSKAI